MDQGLDRYMNAFIQSRHYTIWQLIKSYWHSEQRFLAYVFFAIVVGLTLCLVSVDVFYNYVYYYGYYALYGAPATQRFFIVSMFFAASYTLFGFYRYYIAQICGLRLLTEKFIAYVLNKQGYTLEGSVTRQNGRAKPKKQSEMRALIKYSIDLSMCLLCAISTFIFFIYILWALSSDLTVSMGDLGKIRIPCYLVWLGVIYAFVGLYYTFRLGRPLMTLRLGYQLHQRALSRAGKDKQLSREKCIIWLSKGYNQAILLLPLFIAWPNFFDKVYYVGGLIQCLYAFGTIQASVLKVINTYNKTAQSKQKRQRKVVLSVTQNVTGVVRKSSGLYLKLKSYWQMSKHYAVLRSWLGFTEVAMCGFYFRE